MRLMLGMVVHSLDCCLPETGLINEVNVRHGSTQFGLLSA